MLSERYTTSVWSSPEHNKEIVRRAFAAMTAGPEAWIAEHDELFGEELVGHFAGLPPIDSKTHLLFGLGTFDAFADLARPVEDLVAEGDRVVARWTSTGTHTGELQGIPATGRSVSTSGITIFRLEGGKIVEEWSETDMMGLLQQVGLFPGAAEAA